MYGINGMNSPLGMEGNLLPSSDQLNLLQRNNSLHSNSSSLPCSHPHHVSNSNRRLHVEGTALTLLTHNPRSPRQESLGQICWLEIPVLDVDRAKKFYTGLFAWEFAPDSTPPVGDCVKSLHFFTKGKTLNGALMHVDEKYQIVNNKKDFYQALPVMPTFCVMDCAEALEKVAELGGKTAM